MKGRGTALFPLSSYSLSHIEPSSWASQVQKSHAASEGQREKVYPVGHIMTQFYWEVHSEC